MFVLARELGGLWTFGHHFKIPVHGGEGVNSLSLSKYVHISVYKKLRHTHINKLTVVYSEARNRIQVTYF